MRIIVIGAGKVGSTLASQLVKEGHEVVVMDTNQERLDELQNRIDIMTLCGNGASKEYLEEAEVAESDLVIAATSADEVNILSCFIARQIGASKTIARVRNPEYRNQLELMKEELGLSMIVNPELSAASEISRILRFPSANDVELFCRGHVELVEYTIGKDCPLCELSLKEIYVKYKIRVLICAVRRGDDITIPKGEFVLKEGDKINITASPKNIHDFFEAIGSFKRPVKSVMIVGGSMIAYYLANQLIDMNIDVKIVDMNTKRCEELSEMLPKASIVCANATENDLLLEEGIMDFDGFVALTGLDEMNIIYGMYAKTKNVEKVITKVHHLSFPEVIESSGIESVVSPKLITAERISSYVRAIQNSYSKNKVESLRRIVDNRIEALEFIVREDESFIGIPLKDLPIKDNVLVAAIVRHGKAIIPGGLDTIKKGDSVVVITPDIASIEELNDIMR
ncbi:MAG: Trk system potassium transporter TrkA [Oscillospiraceae bacterium]|nr:Trk system potassium transporter TrkA [Oscillospiraceae bacterium]